METQSLYPRLRYYYKALVPLFEKPKVAAYTMLVLSFFTISVFGIFAIRPTLATIAQLKKHIEDQKQVDRRMADKISQLRAAQVEYRNIQPHLDAIFEALPDTPQAASLLGKLNRVLIENNIDVTILQISAIVLTQPETVAPSATAIGFTLTGRASYKDILTFVDLLSRTDRIMTIDSIDIAAAPSIGQTALSSVTFVQSDLLTLIIHGKSYVLSQKKGGKGG